MKTVTMKKSGHFASTDGDEEILIDTLTRFADHSIPLTRAQFKEAVSMFIETASKERRRKLLFRNNTPGFFLCRSFLHGIRIDSSTALLRGRRTNAGGI